MPLEIFIKLLQFSVSPIVLISAASLLLLSITNRLGRTIDRSRSLVRELEGGAAVSLHEDHRYQLRILLRRSRLLRWAVICISVSILFSCAMTLGVVLQAFAGVNLALLTIVSLALALLSICAAVIFLFFDVSIGLTALEVEVQRHI